MQPFLKLAKAWPWLPHFRVVAEFESLSRASRRFGISGAALSKAVRTLEKTLEVELFDRAGGKLRLNDHGRALLAAVRADMRHLDDTITSLQSEPSQLLRVALDGAWPALVLQPDDDIELHDDPADRTRALLRGDVDVVVHTERVDHPGIVTEPLATLERAVFVASTRPDTRDLAYVAIRDVGDGWPAAVERDVALVAASLAHAVACVSAGTLAAALPVALATRYGLRRVGGPELGACTLSASMRRSRGTAVTQAARWCERVQRSLAS